MLTARENMLRILRCEPAEWIPVTLYTDPYNHPALDSLPPDLAPMFRDNVQSWGKRWELCLAMAAHMGVNEHMLNAPAPFTTAFDNGVYEEEVPGGDRSVKVIHVPSGTLRQETACSGGEAYVVKRFVQGLEDVPKLAEYFAALRVVPNPRGIEEIREIKRRLGDTGLISLFLNGGTPLGMMYRVYTGIADLVYMIADAPNDMKALFATMEKHYLQAFEATLELAPEIDVLVGIDDTSTTLISPAMFDEFNVDLTNNRAAMIHRYGKYYLHHSCGLIRDLLPIYRKTRMDGVHAFTRPPLGDVTFAEGRKRLGDKISIYASAASLEHRPDAGGRELADGIRALFEDAKAAGHVMFGLCAPSPQYGLGFLERVLAECRKHQIL